MKNLILLSSFLYLLFWANHPLCGFHKTEDHTVTVLKGGGIKFCCNVKYHLGCHKDFRGNKF